MGEKKKKTHAGKLHTEKSELARLTHISTQLLLKLQPPKFWQLLQNHLTSCIDTREVAHSNLSNEDLMSAALHTVIKCRKKIQPVIMSNYM